MKAKQTVLITGATGGIGYALAEIFARNGYNLALTGRNLEKLTSIKDRWERQYNIDIKHCLKDLAVSTTPDEMYQALHAEMIEVDILVNNAGFGLLGEFSRLSLSDQLEMLQVNITALTHLTRLFLPDMIQRKQGKILNVASTAAFLPGPGMAVYYASKAYVLSFSAALSHEVRSSGITVTALCPGPTNTGFQARAGMAHANIFKRMSVMSAEEVAAIGYRGLLKGKPIVVTGTLNTLSAFSTRFMPRQWLMNIVEKLHGTK
ncbi:MAG: SDR family oxidoreductase [Bacteroidota bacterium]